MENEKKEYATKQKKRLLEFLAQHPTQQYTAKQLIESTELSLGEATIYRLLHKLTADGRLTRILPNAGRATAYQYNPVAACHNHLHLKCHDCGLIVCMDCELIADLNQHLKQAHGFTITQEDTTLNGICNACLSSLP